MTSKRQPASRQYGGTTEPRLTWPSLTLVLWLLMVVMPIKSTPERLPGYGRDTALVGLSKTFEISLSYYCKTSNNPS